MSSRYPAADARLGIIGPRYGDPTLWQCTNMAEDEATREELEALVASLRAEVERLKDELRRLRRDSHEVPPHYL